MATSSRQRGSSSMRSPARTRKKPIKRLPVTLMRSVPEGKVVEKTRRQAVHQLARFQFDDLHDSAHQYVLGSNTGCALWLVGLSTKTDDGPVHRSMGRVTDRSSPGLDRCHLWHYDSL